MSTTAYHEMELMQSVRSAPIPNQRSNFTQSATWFNPGKLIGHSRFRYWHSNTRHE